MNKREMLKLVAKTTETITDELGFDFVDSEYVKEFGSNFLQIYIDKPGGISLDDCQLVSEKLSKKLDEKDPIKDPYYLEVSSPGLDRPLKTDKDLKRNLNKEVEIKLYKAIDNKKSIEGILDSFNENDIIINKANELNSIPREYISLIKLKVNF